MSYSSYNSDTDSDSDSDSDESFNDVDPRYALHTRINDTKTIKNDLSAAPGAPWDPKTNITSLKNMVYQPPPTTTKTSLFSLKSINRDKSVYPTPFNFQIKLPRTYKNVTKFQLVQLSFPNSSNGIVGQGLFVSSLVQDMLRQGVPPDCTSSCLNVVNCAPAYNSMAMMELGRTNLSGDPLLTTISIPTGSYSNTQLADELTFQASSTPPLNLISYPDFKDAFMFTRDATVLFNEPGDVFISKTGARISRPTKESIMNTYYTQQHIDSLSSITEPIAFTAYYYPIMVEMVATGLAEPFLTGYQEWKDHTMFEGLQSEYYYATLLANQAVLDNYRPHLTFQLRHANSYTWKYKDNHFVTIHNQLHASIQRDISKQYNTVLQRELSLTSLNPSSFTTLKTNAIAYSSIYKHLETNLSSILGTYMLATNYQYDGTSHITAESTFTAADLAADEDLSAMFQFKSSIGGIYGNYGGTVMQFRNFMDYHSTLTSFYHIVQSTTTAITAVHQCVAASHHMYVSTKYTGILPQKMIDTCSYSSNQGIPVSFVTGQHVYVPGMSQLGLYGASDQGTSVSDQGTSVSDQGTGVSDQGTGVSDQGTSASDQGTSASDQGTSVSGQGGLDLQTLQNMTPMLYGVNECKAICCNYVTNLLSRWTSNLPVNTVIGSLAYRLGSLELTSNKYDIVSTIQTITSTGNLNMLMQINDEQGFNNLDISMNENVTVSQDTTGQLKFVAAKILMGAVGDSGLSQTLIQNPSIFENTLGKLDRLSFKIYYDDPNLTPAWLLVPFQYDINEWNATFQIDEEVGFINQHPSWTDVPSLPIPDNPNDTSYIYYDAKPAK